MKLSEMRQFLTERDIQLTRSLGQNFLHDGNQLDRIINLAELSHQDSILEIGPGLGPLTERLLEKAGKVLAVEKDLRLVAVLKERFAALPNFELLGADALQWLKNEPRDWHDWKLVSNLPYSVGSPLLVELAMAPRPPERLVATLQLEVIQRLMAAAGTDSYGVLSLLVQRVYEPRIYFKIPSGCFFPEPDVESACIALIRRETPWVPQELTLLFNYIVKTSFSQRRKMMFKLLKVRWPVEKLRNAFERCGLDQTIRAEQVSGPKFAELTQALSELDRAS